MHSIRLIAITVAALVVATGCKEAQRTSDPSGVLVAVGGNTLSQSDLQTAMPGGLSPEDSAKFVHAYIRNWIDTQLISEIAASQIDMGEIDKMVEQYRKELIMWEYSRRMYDSHQQLDVSEDSIRNYYDSHEPEFVLRRPMVKGMYVKATTDSKSLPNLRRLYRSKNPADLDRIEKAAIDGAVHYDYFDDTWIDWEQIENVIPYDFGDSPDAFLRGQRHLDFEKDGFVYLLNITDVLKPGETMPYETARPYIIDRLTFHDMRAYDLILKDKLYQKALSDGTIRLNCNIE